MYGSYEMVHEIYRNVGGWYVELLIQLWYDYVSVELNIVDDFIFFIAIDITLYMILSQR